MPLLNVHFEIAGDAAYSRAFEAMATEATDLREPLGEIADHLVKTVGDQFLTEGARTGRRWHPLSPSYQAWKEAHFPGRPILVQTGHMRAAALDRKRAVALYPDRMVYEIQDDKAVYHQKGSGHLPQRKLVDLGMKDRRAWDRILAEWVNGLRRGPLRRSAA
jgi:hypothetical protein